MLTVSNPSSSSAGSTETEAQHQAQEPVISFENVSVRYRVPRESVSGLKEFAIRWMQRSVQFEDFWALKDVSFEVMPGEIFGIIGRNGAGKSTMLKVMARVLQPTTGRVMMRGNLAPLLELGGGFHPELTGRENVYLNMALLGHNRRETEELFQSIIDFAEIGDFINSPLRTYSTGMVARLGFSVATCFRPDILLVDEVLSVGDSRFQQKCLDRMFDFQEQGTTIIIVSHGMGAIETFCKRALWLEKGQMHACGPVGEVIDGYIHMDDPITENARPVRKDIPPLQARFLPAPEPATQFLDYVKIPYFPLEEVGGVYPAEEILNHQEGSISVWVKFDPQDSGPVAAIFHSDESRYVLYTYSVLEHRRTRYQRKIVARAGGNKRVFDAFYSTDAFPEASVTLTEEDPNRQWRLVTMCWKGYPEGHVRLYIDGELLNEKSYDSRYDDGTPLPKHLAIGMRPSSWAGERVINADGSVVDLRPSTSMSITEGGVTIQRLQLYRQALSKDEIAYLASHPPQTA